MKKLLIVLLVNLILLDFSYAADEGQISNWNNLSPDVQQVLSGFKDRWVDLPENKKMKLQSLKNLWECHSLMMRQHLPEAKRSMT